MAHDPKFEAVPEPKDLDAVLIVEPSAALADFDRSMDEQLQLLVARWIHWAAPNAQRVERTLRRFGR